MNLQKIERFQDKVSSKLVPFATKLSNQRHLAAIRDAMAILIPLTIIGGFSILLAQPPVNPDTMTDSNFFYSFLLGWYNWAQANMDILMIPYNLTLGAISLYVVGAVSFHLAGNYKLPKLELCFTSILTYLCIGAAPQTLESGSFMPTVNLGAGGMFTAIIVAIIVVEITNLFIKNDITIKMPSSVPPNVAAPFRVLIPMAVNVIGFILLNVLCKNVVGGGICELLTKVLSPLFSATDSLPSILFLLVVSQLFWFFGIHGDNMVGGVVTPIITMNVALNLEAYNAGEPMTYIFAGQFNGVWGGWMASWAILIAMILVCKSQQLKSLSKLAPLSTLFNINEPLVFGIPEVLNVFMIIPMLLCTVLNVTIAYFATYFHIIGNTYIVLPWTTPAPLAAFLSTMDWRALVLWIVIMVIDIIIVIPFMKQYDNQLLKEENDMQSKNNIV